MTNPNPLGQRLREWREANGLTIDDVADRLDLNVASIKYLEADIWPYPESRQRIETLIATPNPDADQIVAGATAAIRAAVEAGATSVRIVRPETPEHGRVTVILGDDPEWRKWI